MPESQQKRNYLELFDVSKNSVIATVPMNKLRHVPRTGERIFLPVHDTGAWNAYRIVDIEYFLSTDQAPLDEPGMIRMTVYVEVAK